MQLRPASTEEQPWPADRGNGIGEKKGALCEIRALLMVIGPPYDCRVTFDDRTDLIVFYCIRRPTTPTGTFEARVFQTIPIFFLFHPFFFSFFLPFFFSLLSSKRGERELRNDVRNVSRNWFERVYFHRGDTTIALEISRFLPSFSFFFFLRNLRSAKSNITRILNLSPLEEFDR